MMKIAPLVLSVASLVALPACQGVGGEVGIKVQGSGTVRSNPQGIDCSATGGDCEAQLGSSYVLEASPDSGFHLDHWEGDDECTKQGTASIVVSLPPKHKVTCTAFFVADPATSSTPQQ